MTKPFNTTLGTDLEKKKNQEEGNLKQRNPSTFINIIMVTALSTGFLHGLLRMTGIAWSKFLVLIYFSRDQKGWDLCQRKRRWREDMD